MRLCTKDEDLLPLMRAAQQEAEAAFGNGAVYIERYVQNPRHIEFQVGILARSKTLYFPQNLMMLSVVLSRDRMRKNLDLSKQTGLRFSAMNVPASWQCSKPILSVNTTSINAMLLGSLIFSAGPV